MCTCQSNFNNDQRLSQEQKDKVLGWMQGGANALTNLANIFNPQNPPVIIQEGPKKGMSNTATIAIFGGIILAIVGVVYFTNKK